MFKEYLYRGRHRAPTNTGMKIAAVTVATTLPMLAATAQAQAAEPPNWGPIIACESGGDAKAKNPRSTASGLFQFINGTWLAYGGGQFAPTARQATAAEQLIVANRAYAREGYKPWNASKGCWRDEIGDHEPVRVRASAPIAPPKVEPARRVNVVETPIEQYQSLPVVVPAESVPTLGTQGQYEVKPGDTLTNIAIANNVPGGWTAVYEKNRDVVEHADWIFPGEKLNLN